jgi:endogenous inhibitor of DNA gyrase (YacG/DUF329 family)
MSEDRSRDPGEGPPKTPRCPLCGKPRAQRFRPFCSARCRDVDLGRWFDASYAVPAVEPGYDEEEGDG